MLVIAGVFLTTCEAGTLRYDRETALNFEFAGKRTPQWSGGVLSGLESNHTAMPQIVTFEGQSKPAGLLPILVPGSDLIDVADWTLGDGEVVVACGAAYDKEGRNAGFLAIHVSDQAPLRVVRLTPYYPFHIIVAADGTIWTTGMEMVDGHENRPGVSADRGVVRRFDVSGKLLATYIPRRSLPSGLMLTYSHLASGPDRIGWYTGPSHGPTSRYYEITLSGETRVFASPPLSETSHVSGIAIGSDGRAYASTSNPDIHCAFLYSIAPGESAWRPEAVPGELAKAHYFGLYGADGDRLVFEFDYPTHLSFVRIAPPRDLLQ